MKKIALVVFILTAIIFISFLYSQEFTNVGAAKCKICHKTEKRGQQFVIWEESGHAKAFTALSSDDAKTQAADAPDNPECLKCHSPLAEKMPEIKEEGVGCEVCHGPGSAYKKLSVMKSTEESVKYGLTVYDSPEAIKKQCSSCHENNPHDKPFDFEAAWEKIKHPVPETE
jgi:hypothetical protein